MEVCQLEELNFELVVCSVEKRGGRIVVRPGLLLLLLTISSSIVITILVLLLSIQAQLRQTVGGSGRKALKLLLGGFGFCQLGLEARFFLRNFGQQVR